MSQQQRSLQPKKFLDASLGPVENALLEQVRFLNSPAGHGQVMQSLARNLRIHGADTNGQAQAAALAGALCDTLAEQFQALAGELHHW